MIWSKYNYEYSSDKHGRLLFNYLSGAFLDINDKDLYRQICRIKANNGNCDLLDDSNLKSFFIDNGIICENDETNEDILFYNNLRLRTQQAYKTLTIVPTLDCNLKCPYCYEGLDKPHISMNGNVVKHIKQYIDTHIRKQETRLLALIWYGGEPLLEFDTIRDISEYIKQKDIPFFGDITTNGTLLTEDKLKEFDKLNIRQVQISFDGPKEHHNSKRFFANNKGTFDLLMDKCKMLNTYVGTHNNFTVHIRINVDINNKDNSAVLFRELKNKFPLLSIYMAPLKQYHSCSNSVDCFSGDAEVLDYMISLYKDYGIDVVDYKSVLRGMRPCMAELESSIIIGPSGELYLCLNDVGDSKEIVGNIVTGEMNFSQLAKYRNGRLTTYNESCAECNLLWMCGGGCPNSQYRNKYHGERNEVCTPLKQKEMLNKYLDIRYEIQNHTKD